MANRRMKVTFGPKVSNAKNLGGDKETVKTMDVLVVSGGKIVELIDARWYTGRSRSASVVYCSVWLKAPGGWRSGHGSAGGYGYSKDSAAFDEALRSANVEGIDVHGRGMGAVRNAGERIIRALGFKGKLHIITHG